MSESRALHCFLLPALGALAFCVACATPVPPADPAVLLQDGITLELAQLRAATLTDVRYEIDLSIPAASEDRISGRLTARFQHATGGERVIFDFAQPPDAVRGVTVDGEPIPYAVHGEHLMVPAEHVRAGANDVTIDFIAGDGSLNRNADYLYTLFVPDRARVALPVFDQPDLKARVAWRLEIPAQWQAVANGPLVERVEEGDRATWTFAESEPISSYVFAFAAGRFEVAEAERGGRSLRMLHRETDPEKAARNLDAIFDLHATALTWLEDYTGTEYPFQKFDFVAMPAFQYGGMEHPGAIFYRDRSLFLDESATQSQQLGRASLIAHETAHMWFGNLVTMEWFNDVWMKEVFANFMAAKIVNPSFPEVDHELRFLLSHYPSAYGVDRTAGANPIRQALGNLKDAGSLYGAIIYQKAPIVMKHLELLIGEEAFRDGLREYLDGHRYGNATWPDLVDVMDARSDEDIVAWSQVWVNEPGRPNVVGRLDVADGFVERLLVSQGDPADRGRLWNQRMTLAMGASDGTVRRFPLHLRDASVEVGEVAGLPAPEWLLVNGDGVGYGDFVLDDRTRDRFAGTPDAIRRLSESGLRAVAMLSLYDGMLDGEVDPRAVAAAAFTAAVNPEEDELNVARFLSIFGDVWWGYLAPEAHLSASSSAAVSEAALAEATLWARVADAPTARLKATYFNAYRGIARTQEALDRLRSIWSGELEVEGLPLSSDDFTSIAEALAVRGVEDIEAIFDTQRERLDNPDRRARFDFVRPALSADAATRDAFFESLRDPANREHEPWVLAALGALHHPLRARESERYILPSLEMIEEIQRTGDIFFPLGWLSATLGGHSSASAAAIVRTFLDDHPDLAPRLRGKLLQAADPLFRAVRIIGARVAAGSPVSPDARARIAAAADRPPVDFGAPGARQLAASLERLPLDRTVDTRAAYRHAERQVEQMPRYSTGLGRRVDAFESRARELSRWKSLGPGNIGGRTRAMVIDPARPGTLYVGGVSGGVWRSRNGGGRWTAVGDALQNVAVNSMAMDPRDTGTIVVGTGEGYFRENVRGTGLPLRGGGVYRTTDGARNWSFLPSTAGEEFWFVNDLVYSDDGTRLYAGTRSGVFRSDDDGGAWTHVLAPGVQGGCLDLEIRRDRPTDVLFASCGTFDQATVYRATDAGALDSAARAAWTAVLDEPGMGRTSIAIAPSDPDVIYALAASNQTGRYEQSLHAVFRSTSGGDSGTWEPRVRNVSPVSQYKLMLENPVIASYPVCGFGPPQDPIPMGWYVNSLAVDPADPDIVWAGGVDWFRSSDGGTTWGPASYWWADRSTPSFVHADQHGLVFHPDYDGEANRTAYFLTDGGVYRSDDARAAISTSQTALCDPGASGVRFSSLNRSLGITQFYHGVVAPGGAFLVGGTQDNGTIRRRAADRPNDWIRVLGGDGSYAAVDRVEPLIQYFQAQSSNLHKTVDGGLSTFPARSGLPEATFDLLGPGGNFLFITPLTTFAESPERGTESLLTGGRQIFLSSDRAARWSAVSRQLPGGGRVSAIATAPGNGNAVLVGTDRGQLLFTDRLDAAGPTTRWPSKRPRRAWVTSVAIDPARTVDNPANETLYATYGGFGGRHVYRSIDNDGRRWESIDGNLPDIPVHSIVIDPDDGNRLFIGTDLGVFVTTDGGEAWAQEIAGFGNIVTEWLVLSEQSDALYLYAFTHGRSAWRVKVAR